MNLVHPRLVAVLALGALATVVACDDDPASPQEQFTVACPTGVQGVNAPVVLTFSTPVLASTVQSGNVVVSDAATGNEVPGSLALEADGRTVRFEPSSPFAFSQDVRIRVQNLRSEATQTQVPVTLCQVTTEPPPITELPWRELPHAGGLRLRGVSLPHPDTGYVMSQLGVLFRRTGSGDFVVAQQNPYFNAGFDVAFVNARRGFATWDNARGNYSLTMESTDAGATFDSIGVIPVHTAQRTYFREVGGPGTVFGVVGGGNTGLVVFQKYDNTTGTMATVQSSSETGYTNDIDFVRTDTTRGAAVTNGIRVGTFEMRGGLWLTVNGGATWSRVVARTASAATLTYFGVARRNNGDIFVAGGNGYFARLSPDGATETVIPLPLTSINPSDPFALLLTDVQFAPDNDLVGWVIGAQQVGVVNGEPRYQGVIFATRDGGTNWVRQGVLDAPNYGAEFPRLNRLSVYSSTAAWIAGDAGTVLSLQPPAP